MANGSSSTSTIRSRQRKSGSSARIPENLKKRAAGDRLLSINGQPVRSVEQLREVVAKAQKSVALLIERDGSKLFVLVPMG